MAKAKKKLQIEYIPIEQLRPWEGNPRRNDETVGSVVKSIEAFGFSNPILVRRKNNEIIAGHTRILAMKERGETEIPVVFLDLDEADAHTYALFDNKSVENTQWDGLKLADAFAELDQLNVKLDLTGFSAEEIGNIVIGPTGTPPPKDEAQIPDNQFSIVCECGNEAEQEKLYHELQERGYKCRLLTL